MTTYNTGNPVPSTNVKDLYDNAENLDNFSNGTALAYPDRLGVSRKSLAGLRNDVDQFLINSQFELPPLDYVDGTPLQVDRASQVIDRAGQLYRVLLPAAFPVNLTGTWATDEPLLTAMSDEDLRADLAEASDPSKGAALIGFRGRTVKAHLDDVINVKDYGAKGDGVTVDDASIQLAATAAGGKCLYFPPGIYKVINGFDIQGDNSSVIGESATILYGPSAQSYNHCVRIFGNNCRVAGLRIASPSGLVRDDTGFGISAGNVGTASSGLIIEGCVLDSVASAGIWVSNVQNSTVNGNLVVGCKADGIHLSDGCFDSVVSGNILKDNADDHIAIVNDTIGAPYVGRTSVTGNTITGGTGDTGFGVALIGATSATVSGNTISNTRGAGIGSYFWTDTEKGEYLLIDGNQITTTGTGGTAFGGCGIAIQLAKDVKITNNQISNITYDATKPSGAIIVTDSENLHISGNTLTDIASDGMDIKSALTAAVTGNMLGFVAREGILASNAVTQISILNNSFAGVQGVNDINVNLPSGDVRVYGNSCRKAVSVIAATSLIDRSESETSSPTPTAQSGALTAATATLRWQRQGRFFFINGSVTITTNGTAAGAIYVPLPFTASGGVINGRENGVSGKQINGNVEPTRIVLRNYDNTYPGANGASIAFSGVLLAV